MAGRLYVVCPRAPPSPPSIRPVARSSGAGLSESGSIPTFLKSGTSEGGKAGKGGVAGDGPPASPPLPPLVGTVGKLSIWCPVGPTWVHGFAVSGMSWQAGATPCDGSRKRTQRHQHHCVECTGHDCDPNGHGTQLGKGSGEECGRLIHHVQIYMRVFTLAAPFEWVHLANCQIG